MTAKRPSVTQPTMFGLDSPPVEVATATVEPKPKHSKPSKYKPIVHVPGTIYTSQFSGWRERVEGYGVGHLRRVSTACVTPNWFKGDRDQTLMPSREMIKTEMEVDDYWQLYWDRCLKGRNVKEMIAQYRDCILFCWCSQDVPCHRRMLAEYLEHFGKVVIPELGVERSKTETIIDF